MTAPKSTVSPADPPRKPNVNPTQVTAGALAAVTAAVLGSQLGAAGTVIGAAGASVITTVGTAVYYASLERSRARVRSLALRTRSLPASRQPGTDPPSTAAVATVNAPLGDDEIAPLGDDEAGTTPREPPSAGQSRGRAALRWGAMVVATVGAFGLAMLAITGFELVSGQSVGGNGKGTTLGNVVQAPPDNPRRLHPVTPSAPPNSSAPPSSEAPSHPSETPTTSTSATPDDGSSSVPESPTPTSDRPPPSAERPPAPPVIPTRIPGIGG